LLRVYIFLLFSWNYDLAAVEYKPGSFKCVSKLCLNIWADTGILIPTEKANLQRIALGMEVK